MTFRTITHYERGARSVRVLVFSCGRVLEVRSEPA